MGTRYRLTETEKKIVARYLHDHLNRRGKIFWIKQAYGSRRNPDEFIDENGFVIANDGTKFEPYEEQARFVLSKSPIVLFIGGRGSGKTAAGAQKAVRLALEGKSGLVVNPDFQNLVFSTWGEFRRWLPFSLVVESHRRLLDPTWRPHTSFYITLRNGATVWFKGTRSEESAVGGNVNWVWVDEAARTADGTPILRAMANARVGDNPQQFITTTPKGKVSALGGKHWLYDFYERGLRGESGIEVFKGDSGKNRFVHDSYRKMLEKIYPVGTPLYMQEVLGEFIDTIGEAPDISKIRIIDGVDNELFTIVRRVRFWDLAATKGGGDYTVGTLVLEVISKDDGTTYWVVAGQYAFRESFKELVTHISAVARRDGSLVPQVFEQEPGASGKLFIDSLRRIFSEEAGLSDVVIDSVKPRGDRVLAAQTLWYPLLDRIFVVRAEWTEAFLGEMAVFPQGVHDDRVTSFTGAMAYLLSRRRVSSNIEYMRIDSSVFSGGDPNVQSKRFY